MSVSHARACAVVDAGLKAVSLKQLLSLPIERAAAAAPAAAAR
jgi:ribosomal protein L12E/L44/L45/RPP1/RPP2